VEAMFDRQLRLSCVTEGLACGEPQATLSFDFVRHEHDVDTGWGSMCV
jgi:hypothetical protein